MRFRQLLVLVIYYIYIYSITVVFAEVLIVAEVWTGGYWVVWLALNYVTIATRHT